MTQLMLIFRAGDERYAIEAKAVVEIIPRVELSAAHGLKRSDGSSILAGRFNYHGQIVPVLDLSQLLAGAPSRSALGTRIVLVQWASPTAPAEQAPRLMGLLIEQVTETLEGSQLDLGVAAEVSGPRYFGKTLLYEQAMIQCVQVEHLPFESEPLFESHFLTALPPLASNSLASNSLALKSETPVVS